MRAYKFLGLGARGLYSGFCWPTPQGDHPADWVEVSGQLIAGVNGVHALRTSCLIDWIDDELWRIELGDEIEEQAELLVARRGRLVSRVAGWDAEAAADFGRACIWRVRDRAVETLGRAGLEHERGQLAAATKLDPLQAVAVVQARDTTGSTADVLTYLADTIQVSRGGWFESYDDHPGAEVTPTPGAIAANIGFVSAMAAGEAAAAAADDAGVFDDGYEGERERQLAWLTERLELEPV